MRWQQQCCWWLTHDRMVEAGVVTVWSISSWLVTSNISPASYLVITEVRWSADHSRHWDNGFQNTVHYSESTKLSKACSSMCIELCYFPLYAMWCDVMCAPPLCNWCKIITQWRCRVRGPGLETPGYSEQCVLCIMSTRAINGGSRKFYSHREGPY